MIKEYLKTLKAKGNYSWNDISVASGLPEATIRKIFSGETADPRFETVTRLVNAMGGSIDKINEIEKIEKSDDSQLKSLATVKEIYEERIKDIKAHMKSLEKDKKILTITVFVFGVFLVATLLLDIFVGTIGWVRY